jgi:hypothetical protein
MSAKADRWVLAGLVAALALMGAACSIKVYRVDQQTVLEDEAAGEWPEFEKEILGKTQASTPTPFPTIGVSERKARLYNVLNDVAREPWSVVGGDRERGPSAARKGVKTARAGGTARGTER